MSETCSIGDCTITCGDDTYGCICVLMPDGSCSCDCVQDVRASGKKETNLSITLDSEVYIKVRGVPRVDLCAYLNTISDVSIEDPLRTDEHDTVDAVFESGKFSDILQKLDLAYK